MTWNTATRQKLYTLPQKSKPTGGGVVSWDIPKTGILSKIYLSISATVSGTLSNPNPLGAAAIIKNVRLTLNSGVDLYNVSGAGYSYLLQEVLGSGLALATGNNQGRSAVSAATFRLDQIIPVMVNDRDPVGAINLQNEQTLVTLSVEFESDSTVATGATVTATVDPMVEIFTMPLRAEDRPPFDLLHNVLEERMTVSGAGQVDYVVPRGNTYLAILHGLGIGASGSDAFSSADLVINQADYIYKGLTPALLNLVHYQRYGRARPSGAILYDLMGSSGLGSYGTGRDVINSALVTDLRSRITATGAGTLITVRRQLVQLA